MLTAYLTSVADSTDSADLDSLLRRIAVGEQAALGMLYDQLSHGMYVYALSLLKDRNDAQDALQDSILAVVRGASSYRARGKAKAWIYTIVHNRCMQSLREHKRTYTSLDEVELPDDSAEATEARLLLSTCLKQLSEEESRIVILHAVSGFRHREIAAMLELPLPTVLSKYNRALKKLRTILEG
ncbi:MAG: sigma-70 family RNA polymerase sigma factor [Clostridia bacterium]|nr:sigma-70 family RNA polymerase sigma factor [Clostridia bacterium]